MGWRLTKARRDLIKRRVLCAVGQHRPGRIEPRPGGVNIQRCEWCDKKIASYAVTINNQRRSIRRVQ